MSHRTVLRASAAGALVVALAVPTASYAGTLTHSDPAQDVQKITDSGSGTTIEKAPDNQNADIVRLSARYGATRLKETVRLRRVVGRHWFLSSRIETATRHFELLLVHQGGSDQVSLTRGRRHLQIVCDGLLPEIDRVHNKVSVSVPAECLFAPHAVRIGVGFVSFGKAQGVTFADDALRRRGTAEAELTLSEKIHQG